MPLPFGAPLDEELFVVQALRATPSRWVYRASPTPDPLQDVDDAPLLVSARWDAETFEGQQRFLRGLAAEAALLPMAVRRGPAGLNAVYESPGGHLLSDYRYYGVPGNSQALGRFRHEALNRWKWALGRRSQRYFTWARFEKILRRHP